MMTARLFDLSLYLVIGSQDTAGRPLTEVVAAAVAGGVTLVQLREKHAPTQQAVELARALRKLLQPSRIPLIINDDLEAAIASEAEGLHIGQEDLSAAEARHRLPPGRILGLSVGSAAEAAGADPALVDYIGLGPVYATPTKSDAGEALLPAGIKALRDLLPNLPAVAIGGIKQENAAAVMASGVDGVAVVSAIAAAADPAAAARALRQAIGKPIG